MNFLEGQNYIKKKEFRKALNFFLKLEKEKIQDDKIFFYLGIIYFEINEFEKSILYYEKYLDNLDLPERGVPMIENTSPRRLIFRISGPSSPNHSQEVSGCSF